jgi:hypothetical protein
VANSKSSDRIEAAFVEALKDHEMSEDGDILGDWLIIGHLANPDRTDHGYPMLFSNGNVPGHVARGLLKTGILIINGGIESFDD